MTDQKGFGCVIVGFVWSFPMIQHAINVGVLGMTHHHLKEHLHEIWMRRKGLLGCNSWVPLILLHDPACYQRWGPRHDSPPYKETLSWDLNEHEGFGGLIIGFHHLLPHDPTCYQRWGARYDSPPFKGTLLSDSYPAFFLPIATTSNKNFLKVKQL